MFTYWLNIYFALVYFVRIRVLFSTGFRVFRPITVRSGVIKTVSFKTLEWLLIKSYRLVQPPVFQLSFFNTLTSSGSSINTYADCVPSFHICKFRIITSLYSSLVIYLLSLELHFGLCFHPLNLSQFTVSKLPNCFFPKTFSTTYWISMLFRVDLLSSWRITPWRVFLIDYKEHPQECCEMILSLLCMIYSRSFWWTGHEVNSWISNFFSELKFYQGAL